MAAIKMSLKLLVDKRNRTVLFAEAGKDFVDFLFHFLTLPVGTIASILPEAGVVASLCNLYASVENLSDPYIEPRVKETLLTPKAQGSGPDVLRSLLPEAPPLARINCYTCPRSASLSGTPCGTYVTDSPSTRCPGCNNVMHRKLSWVAGPAASAASSARVTGREGGYVRGVVTYVVMDNLVVRPMSTISYIALLNRFKVQEIGDIEEKVVDFGLDEAVKLLIDSLHSKAVLTDMFSGVLAECYPSTSKTSLCYIASWGSLFLLLSIVFFR